MAKYIEKIHQEGVVLQGEVRERLVGYMVGAFGLIAGLAWNDAVRGLIDYVYPASGANTIWAKFVYAVIVTCIVVVVTVYITRFLKRQEKKEESILPEKK